jgi:uncharacterized paraquat-inducible protein A
MTQFCKQYCYHPDFPLTILQAVGSRGTPVRASTWRKKDHQNGHRKCDSCRYLTDSQATWKCPCCGRWLSRKLSYKG